MSDGKFRRLPTPDPAVVDLLQGTLDSAKEGRISAIVVVVADRLQHVETVTAGELSEVRITTLLGGLTRAASKLLKLLEAITSI